MSDTPKYYSLWDTTFSAWARGFRSIPGYPVERQDPPNVFALTLQECTTWWITDWGRHPSLVVKELPPELLEKALAYQKMLIDKRKQMADQIRRTAYADKYL